MTPVAQGHLLDARRHFREYVAIFCSFTLPRMRVEVEVIKRKASRITVCHRFFVSNYCENV